jgi:hypothetical protein
LNRTIAVLLTDAVWLNGAEIYQDTHEARSSAPPATDCKVLGAFRFTVVVQSGKW